MHFPIKAEIKNDKILNLDHILNFLATNPKITHGEGKLVASVCNAIDYKKARAHITHMQNQHFIRYAAFIKNACNCARFVTDALIASITNPQMKKNIENSKWFTPSTVGNVLLSNTEAYPFEVSETGEISEFKGSQKSENLRCFLDPLKGHKVNLVGTLIPKPVDNLHKNAQWLSGIAAGAWFELHKTDDNSKYRFRRISPYGNIDVDDFFTIENDTFNHDKPFQFVPYSNCKFFHIKQNDTVFRFDRLSE